jgi:hypothetical protein
VRAALLVVLISACSAPAVDVDASASSDAGRPLPDASVDVGVDAPVWIDAGPPPAFVFGLSMLRPGQLPMAVELGADAVRPTLAWRVVEPMITPTGLTRADVTNDTAVRAWAETIDFTTFDRTIDDIALAGVDPVPLVGHGWSRTLPALPSGTVANPDDLGREEYLARQYRFVRALVERYDADGVDDAPSHVRVELWQIENELNEARFTTVLGWRQPAETPERHSAWADNAFLDELITVLATAVRDADPTARVTHNFHTDVPASFDRAFGIRPFDQAIAAWSPLLDLVALDAYPNYARATPLAPEVVGERVAIARGASLGRHVIVMETGYPTGPTDRGYSEEGQRAYAAAVLDSIVEAGAVGIFWFGTATPDVPDGSEDITSVEPYWGVVRPDGSHKPAWDVLHAFALAH